MATLSRDEIIEDKLRHILGRLERMEKVGKKDYLRLDPVEATALAIVLKERVADYTMKRYSTLSEERTLEEARQTKILMAQGQAIGGGGAHIQPSQILAIGLGYAASPPAKKKWWNP